MHVIAAEFLMSGTDPTAGAGWPPEGPPEIAFVGRSNVGKSSLLQALMQRKGLVRISRTPGRTRLINFFRVAVEDRGPLELRLVDLPGFGYAKVSKEERKGWFEFVEKYLAHRASLKACVLLIDGRRGAELDETELEKWLSARGVSVLPVLTKADKLAKHERKPAAERVRQALGRAPLIVSATEGSGVEDLWRRLLVAVRGAAE
jgi:GTP-binding protein